MSDDAELLRRYVENHAEDAFAELVRRHLDLVYSVALRQVGGDAYLAEDVVQVVFTALARKAATLAGRPVLGGWLYRTAQFAAIDVVRAEQRRRQREEAARVMHDVTNSAGETVDWETLRPSLDQAIGELGDDDRDAVVLRFFHGQPFAEIGARLHLTENAARMRVERALDKLHALLARRGVTSTTAALGLALGNQTSMAAPAGLAATVSGAALASATSGGGAIAALGTLLTMSKIKVGIMLAVLLGGATATFLELRANQALRAELGGLATEDPVHLQREEQRLNATLAQQSGDSSGAAELAQLRGRAAVLRARPPGVTDSSMRLASTWSNVGRATPAAAFETFCWATHTGNLDEVAAFVLFEDNSAEARAAFMAQFGEPVRAKYQTPERLFADVLFNVLGRTDRSPDDAVQLIDVQERPDGFRLRMWMRFAATGREMEGRDSYQRTPDGLKMKAINFADVEILRHLKSLINPLTGERIAVTTPGGQSGGVRP